MIKAGILPYKYPATPALDLARKLRSGGERVFRLEREGRPKSMKFLVNWGSCSLPARHFNYSMMLNTPVAVEHACNKKHFLVDFRQYLRDGGHDQLADAIPETVTTKEEVYRNFPLSRVYCRHLLRASGGRGITVCERGEELPDAQLYVRHAPNSWEYRVHVFNGKVIHVQQKKKIRGSEASNAIRNHSRGWIFAIQDVEVRPDIQETCCGIVHHLNLQFAAVDVVESKDGPFKVLEVNTAPNLEGTTLERYAQAFQEYFEMYREVV